MQAFLEDLGLFPFVLACSYLNKIGTNKLFPCTLYTALQTLVDNFDSYLASGS